MRYLIPTKRPLSSTWGLLLSSLFGECTHPGLSLHKFKYSHFLDCFWQMYFDWMQLHDISVREKKYMFDWHVLSFLFFLSSQKTIVFCEILWQKSLVLVIVIMYTSYLHIIIEEVTKVVQINASHLYNVLFNNNKLIIIH